MVQGILKVEAVSDRGFASMGNISFGNFPGLIKDAYSGFFEYFLDSTMINNFWGGRYKINCIFGVCAMAVLIIVLCRAKVALYRKIVAIIGILMLPIPIMSIMIMAPEVSVYDSTGVLMLPTMNYVYIGFCVMAVKYSELFDVKLRRALKSILACCCGLVCYMLCVLELSGQAYMKHYMNKTQAVAYSMVEQIETVVDNSEDYTVCFIGEMENGNYPEVYESLRNSVHWTTAYHKTMWTSFQGRQGGWISYIAHYMGKTYRSCSQADYDRIVQSAEYARMQNFPDELGIMVIDDIIVIKLSDV